MKSFAAVLFLFLFSSACSDPIESRERSQSKTRSDVALTDAATIDAHDANVFDSGPKDAGVSDADTSVPLVFTTEEDLKKLYDDNGGVAEFPMHHVSALEALLYSEDDLIRGDLESARARVANVFQAAPMSTPIWNRGTDFKNLNYGHPIAYYGLRMLDQILRLEPLESIGTLRMTAVVAKCADIERPTLPDLVAETVKGEIDPRILEDDAKILHTATHLFRRWVRAITGGMDVELVVHVIEVCSKVTFNVQSTFITSYPNAYEMIAEVPKEISDETDFWWVVTPSGVPGDGSMFDKTFITGGMGVFGANRPLFLSDDKWFTTKPAHLGVGPYSTVEVRAYQPQWFQHEFMHHLFRSYPELELETNPHQWFDRTTWPSDFVGFWEPDYYIESIDKRLLAVQPALSETLKAPKQFDPSTAMEDDLAGVFKRTPVTNGWHDVTISANPLTWTNAAGVSWSLDLGDDGLFSGVDCVYGVKPIAVEMNNGKVTTLWFEGEAYNRVE